MTEKKGDYRTLVKEVRRQMGVSQEDLARELGVSYATINRWENGQVQPSRLASKHFLAFCSQKAEEGRLDLSVKKVIRASESKTGARAGIEAPKREEK